MTDYSPSLEGFLVFIRETMVISTTYLPDDAPVIAEAYDMAIAVTNLFLAQAPGPIYRQAVYNFGGDYIINWAPDQTGETYFDNLRTTWNIYDFISGVIEASSDESSSQTLVVPKAAETFTLSDLQNLKTPYGRQYLALAQRFGTLWGMN